MRILLTSLIFLSFTALAQVRPYQTARLKSTGGTGVASLLVTESAVLNPAGLAFFSDSFASYQRSGTSLNDKNAERVADGRGFARVNRAESYFIFDNSSSIKGGFSYQQVRENAWSRDRISGVMAMMLTESLAAGVIVNHTKDNRPNWFSDHRHKTSNPVVLGLTWLPVDDLTIGAIYEDVSNALRNESRAVAGVQYTVTQDLVLMADGGGDPRADFSERHLWRVAGQYRLFSDFYARVGKYQDKTINEEGFGWGVSWTGPKLGADLAMKRGTQIDREKGYIYPNEKLTDLSFAVNLRF